MSSKNSVDQNDNYSHGRPYGRPLLTLEELLSPEPLISDSDTEAVNFIEHEAANNEAANNGAANNVDFAEMEAFPEGEVVDPNNIPLVVAEVVVDGVTQAVTEAFPIAMDDDLVDLLAASVVKAITEAVPTPIQDDGPGPRIVIEGPPIYTVPHAAEANAVPDDIPDTPAEDILETAPVAVLETAPAAAADDPDADLEVSDNDDDSDTG